MASGLALVLGRWLDRPGWGLVRRRVGSYLEKPRGAIPEPPRLRLETPSGVLVATPERLPGETVYGCARRTHPGRADIMLCGIDLALLDPAEEVGAAEVLVTAIRREGDTVERLVRRNKLGELRWVIAHGCQWHPHTSNRAAQYGHLELLQWAIANGCEWCSSTSCYAAEKGHTKLLKWAVANGCRWNECTSYYAASNGHFELLVWALANGCELHPQTQIVAQRQGHTEIEEWLDAR